jgi:hypothetical protein
MVLAPIVALGQPRYSWGDPLCRASDMTARVDTAAAPTFLASYGVTAPAA